MKGTGATATTRRRGRPLSIEGAAVTREKLLQLTARAIGRDGLARVSMRGIAREAGISLASLQHHFRTKDALWRAVIDEWLLASVERSQAPTDIVTLFESMVHHRLDTKASGLTGRLFTDGSPDGDGLLAYLAEVTHELRASDRQRLSAIIEAGLLRPISIDALMSLMGIAVPVLSSAKSAVRLLVGVDLEDEEARRQLAGSIVDIFLYGLLPRHSEPG